MPPTLPSKRSSSFDETLVALGCETIEGQGGDDLGMVAKGTLSNLFQVPSGRFIAGFQPSAEFSAAISGGYSSLVDHLSLPTTNSFSMDSLDRIGVRALGDLTVDATFDGVGSVRTVNAFHACVSPLGNNDFLYFYSAAGPQVFGRKKLRGLSGVSCITGSRILRSGATGFEEGSLSKSKPYVAFRFVSSRHRPLVAIRSSQAHYGASVPEDVAFRHQSLARTIPPEEVRSGYYQGRAEVQNRTNGLYLAEQGDAFDLSGHRVGKYSCCQKIAELPDKAERSESRGPFMMDFHFDNAGSVTTLGGTFSRLVSVSPRSVVRLVTASTTVVRGTGDFEGAQGVQALCSGSPCLPSHSAGGNFEIDGFYQLRYLRSGKHQT